MDLRKYFQELKRRKVFKAAVAYLAVAWVLIEVASAVLPAFDTPPFVMKALIILLAMGFLVNLVFSWVYDVTPEGLKKTEELPDTGTASQTKGRRLNRVIIGFLSIAVIILVYNQFGRSRAIPDKAANTPIESETTLKSIAVMPFKDNSPAADHEWLASQMVDNINNNLSKIGTLRVIANRSVVEYVNTNSSTKSIAKDLKLTHLLEGSVFPYGHKIRISVQLISPEDYSQIWSKDYDQEMDSIYNIIDEVAASVGRELNFEFNDSEVRIPDAERTSNSIARELFEKAMYETSKVTGKVPSIVRDYLEQAIQLDSTFYAAYAALGYYWSSQYTWDGDPSSGTDYREIIEMANALYEYTIENAPLYGDPYRLLATNRIWYDQDFKAYTMVLKGYELNPTTDSKVTLTNMFLPALENDFERNYRLALEVIKESPLDPGSWAIKGLAEYFLGKHEDAINTLEKGMGKFRDNNLNSTAGRIFYALGSYQKVVNLLEASFVEFPDNRPARDLGYLAAAHYKLGNVREYESLMEELKIQTAHSPIGSPAFHLAMVSAQTGDHDTAFQWLDKAMADKEVELFWLKVEPPFEPLYGDPRWEVLMEEMGFNDIPKTY